MQSSVTKPRDDLVPLIGLDFGSTTSGAMIAHAHVLRDCVTGRMELGRLSSVFRSDPVFTPWVDDQIDLDRLGHTLDGWLAASGVDPDAIRSGGAILTGLAAIEPGAEALARLVRARFGDALIATADDPGLESWLAFMGNTRRLSQAFPDQWFLNIDIGGGTTNLALGRDGEVRRVGAYFIGARHLRFVPGTYQLVGRSPYGTRLMTDLGIDKQDGDVLDPEELDVILDCHLGMLEAILTGDTDGRYGSFLHSTEQMAFAPVYDRPLAITLSGGVGELAYRSVLEQSLPPTTTFGDLGIDLARRLCASPVISPHLRRHVPTDRGRATLYGLVLHNTEVSGATLFLPDPNVLPLADVPIVGRLTIDSDDREVHAQVRLAREVGRATCLQIESGSPDAASIKAFGRRLAAALQACGFPPDRPLVLLVAQDVGKSLGNYTTDWGRTKLSLVVIDEVPKREAGFANIGRLCNNWIPVCFYGM